MRTALAVVALCLCDCTPREGSCRLDDGGPDVFVTLKPSRPYREIALIRVDTDNSTVSRLRELTRLAGGDACIVTGHGVQHHRGFFIIAFGLVPSGSDTTEAVVIAYQ